MTEQEFLKNYNSSDYEKPSVAVDIALFTIRDNQLQVLLKKRNTHPFVNMLALPATFVGMDETLDECAQRALYQKTGLQNIYLEQLYTWGEIDRDPRMRIISVSYYALVPDSQIQLSESEQEAKFYPVDEIKTLAFDHEKIIAYGRERIRNKINYTDIAFSLVPEEFTLPQLQKIYEILLNQKLYKANFRKKIADKIQPTEKMLSGNKHRPSRIYKKK
ncbi:MAG: NUDIX hydrolase [Oscillospiraceae bacterium]|nr:NUDIX hydrolase [Oscillospiraceae bacterium]MDE6657457.1 NUDIX hydrolase [Oscillospiraceae bacterium]